MDLSIVGNLHIEAAALLSLLSLLIILAKK
jgi:hypothetical protein